MTLHWQTNKEQNRTEQNSWLGLTDSFLLHSRFVVLYMRLSVGQQDKPSDFISGENQNPPVIGSIRKSSSKVCNSETKHG